MSRDGSIRLLWPDEERTYRLRIGELRELQERCGNRGPQEICDALASRRWLVDDIVQPVRLGLIGGGMTQADAAKFVAVHLGDGRLAEGILVAHAILMAAIVGAPDEKIDEAPGAGPLGEPLAPPDLSGSAPSTKPAAPSDGQPDKSIN